MTIRNILVPDSLFSFFLAQVLESEIRMSLSGPVACPETFNTESDEVGTLRPNESSWV